MHQLLKENDASIDSVEPVSFISPDTRLIQYIEHHIPENLFINDECIGYKNLNRPLICEKWQQYGHSAKACKSKQRCPK